jgi:hypothetical protein
MRTFIGSKYRRLRAFLHRPVAVALPGRTRAVLAQVNEIPGRLAVVIGRIRRDVKLYVSAHRSRPLDNPLHGSSGGRAASEQALFGVLNSLVRSDNPSAPIGAPPGPGLLSVRKSGSDLKSAAHQISPGKGDGQAVALPGLVSFRDARNRQCAARGVHIIVRVASQAGDFPESPGHSRGRPPAVAQQRERGDRQRQHLRQRFWHEGEYTSAQGKK